MPERVPPKAAATASALWLQAGHPDVSESKTYRREVRHLTSYVLPSTTPASKSVSPPRLNIPKLSSDPVFSYAV